MITEIEILLKEKRKWGGKDALVLFLTNVAENVL
jgi:hypothetical protein